MVRYLTPSAVCSVFLTPWSAPYRGTSPRDGCSFYIEVTGFCWVVVLAALATSGVFNAEQRRAPGTNCFTDYRSRPGLCCVGTDVFGQHPSFAVAPTEHPNQEGSHRA